MFGKFFKFKPKMQYFHGDSNGKLRMTFTNEQIIKEMLKDGIISRDDDLYDYIVIKDIVLKINDVHVYFYTDDFILERENV